MKMSIFLVGALVSSISTSAVAQPTAAPRACLRFGEIYSWKVLDPKTVVVEDNWHRKFKMSLMGYCPNLSYRERIGFRSPGASDLTCMTPGDELIVNQFGTGAQRCPISSIVTYTPAMEAADKVAAAAKAGAQ
jgi:hypothetical protein